MVAKKEWEINKDSSRDKRERYIDEDYICRDKWEWDNDKDSGKRRKEIKESETLMKIVVDIKESNKLIKIGVEIKES